MRLRPAGRHPPQHLLNSPTLLDGQMRLRSAPNIRFAGQITGVEGYVESAAMGLLAGRMAAAEIGPTLPPAAGTTAMGALMHHITGGAEAKTFQPMNVNFGLFPAGRWRARRTSRAGKTATRPIPTAPRPTGRAGWGWIKARTPPPPNELDRAGRAALALVP
jgi:methylenetetrahydrofolate--tRNA-(uracil-5-)-methyltransferase